MPDDEPPDLPYDGSSGWSGSETSRERAEHDDSTGVTGARQRAVLSLALERGADGVTWREVAETLDIHHGSASGALSVLHKVDRLARLSETRGKAKVYVLPEFVEGRATERHGYVRSSLRDRMLDYAIDLLRSTLDPNHDHDSWRSSCWQCRAGYVVARYDNEKEGR